MEEEIFINSCEVQNMIERKFDFWQDHSLNFLQMAFGHERRERLQNPDGYARRTGECGDTIEMYLHVKNGTIQSVYFETDGCINTNACANAAAHLAEGKPIDQAWEITPDDVIEFLETLPEENFHCAELAVGSFYGALANYQELQRSSWKKPYLRGQKNGGHGA
jgi:nitrogen fixation NifU-like protein